MCTGLVKVDFVADFKPKTASNLTFSEWEKIGNLSSDLSSIRSKLIIAKAFLTIDSKIYSGK